MTNYFTDYILQMTTYITDCILQATTNFTGYILRGTHKLGLALAFILHPLYEQCSG